MILTDVGEIGVYFEGREFILRPSLYAMTKLGNGQDIVATYALVAGGELSFCLAVIQACTEEDIRDVFGFIDERLTFNKMFASAGEIIIIAQSLMKHGIIGDVDRSKDDETKKKEYSDSFDAKSYVSLAIAHLGVSEREAWAMTMTSIVGALRAKFPPEPSKYMSEKEENDLLKWFEENNK